ncbi:MAG: hypothetical protein ACKESC_00880 [Candidatus Hodgkinia cicadicola]
MNIGLSSNTCPQNCGPTKKRIENRDLQCLRYAPAVVSFMEFMLK